MTSSLARSSPTDLANGTPAVPSQQFTTTNVRPAPRMRSIPAATSCAPIPLRRQSGSTVTNTSPRWVLSRVGIDTPNTATTVPSECRATAVAAGSPSQPCRRPLTKSLAVELSWCGQSTIRAASTTATAPATSAAGGCAGSIQEMSIGPRNHFEYRLREAFVGMLVKVVGPAVLDLVENCRERSNRPGCCQVAVTVRDRGTSFLC